MTRPSRPPRAVVLDVEGTTTSLAFVKDVLFPLSRREMRSFVASKGADGRVKDALDQVAATLRAEGEPPPSGPQALAAALERWIDEDRKHPALKALQGMIWRGAWESGAVVSHVYEDVRPALERWKERGARVAIFSSGSVEAQRLLFRHSAAGDLGALLAAFFDPTTAGPKREAASYSAIASALGAAPADVLFVSDVEAELDAAREAGLRTAQVVREGVTPSGRHERAASFEALP